MVYLCFTIPRVGRVPGHTDALPVEHYTHHTHTHTHTHAFTNMVKILVTYIYTWYCNGVTRLLLDTIQLIILFLLFGISSAISCPSTHFENK